MIVCETGPIVAEREEEYEGYTWRLSRLPQRILHWLVVEYQRTNGVKSADVPTNVNLLSTLSYTPALKGNV